VTTSYVLLAIVGMTVITVITRALFLIPRREVPLPPWALQGLRYAPLAALIAVIAPEILLTDGELVATWQDPRLFAVAAGTVYFAWRRGILGTIVTGTAALLALRIGLGW
jgi:branched-subunit amino acid transport protein